jgi:hypothetical protein
MRLVAFNVPELCRTRYSNERTAGAGDVLEERDAVVEEMPTQEGIAPLLDGLGVDC